MTRQRREWLHCLAALPAPEAKVSGAALDALWRLGHVTEGAGAVWRRTDSGEALHAALLREASRQTRGTLAAPRLALRLGRVVRSERCGVAGLYLRTLDDPAVRRRARRWLEAREGRAT